MKKLRILLSVLAILFAVGGAVASQAVQNQVYWFVNDECEEIDLECDIEGDVACKFSPSDPDTFRSGPINHSTCGIELMRDLE